MSYICIGSYMSSAYTLTHYAIQVTGNKVNRGAGLGLEIPCAYRLYGPKVYCDRLKKILEESTS